MCHLRIGSIERSKMPSVNILENINNKEKNKENLVSFSTSWPNGSLGNKGGFE